MIERFYLIVDNSAWLVRLLPVGVKLVQLRVKDLAPDKLRDEIARCRDLCAKFGATLIVNDFWREAIDLDCDYIHLGQEDLDGADIPAIRRAKLRVGISTHSHEELERALSFDPDYVALGPVFPTTLKKMPWAPQGHARVTEWKKRIGDIPLVAIGGLTVQRAPEVYAAGADSIAVVSDVLSHPSPEARATSWLAL
jgi:thiamine-phosphate pyrophosphorylase